MKSRTSSRRRPILPRDRKPRGPLEYFALMGTTSKYAIVGIAHLS